MTRANTKRGNMVREKRKENKRKAWRIRRVTSRRENIK